MKKILLVIALVLSTVILAACNTQRGYADCDTPDGTQACWSAEDENFRWEEGAVIVIGVDNDTLGAALVEKWNADFPALANKLQFRNYGSANGANSGVEGIETGQGDAPDVALVIDNEITGRLGSLLALHPYFADLGAEQTLNSAFEAVNVGANTYFLPSFYDGMTFSWNETMLTQFGVDVTDANGDGLPDALDTWEKIFAWAGTWTTFAARPTFTFTKADSTVVNNKILEVFPISLDEPWSGYSSVSAAGWQLFPTNDMAVPGFDAPEFLGGLQFIQAFSNTNMSVDDTGAKKNADAMGWRWDAYLDGAYPFSLVGTWMDVSSKVAENNLTFRFSPMPTYNGVQLTPIMKTKGFVINGFTEAPSAASEVLRWLYTKPVLEVMIDSSTYLPALEADAEIFPNISQAWKTEFAVGMRYNFLEPGGALPLAATIRAMNVYYSIGVTDFYKAVWNGTQTPAQAQTAIASAASAWVAANNTAS
jgi:arabinogalactan oligomer / maltooligosaccharide transport system substrate-binding protein